MCTAPLTNAAVLLLLYPEVAGLLEQIVLMGGAIGSGNTNPSAEFNMQVSAVHPLIQGSEQAIGLRSICRWTQRQLRSCLRAACRWL